MGVDIHFPQSFQSFSVNSSIVKDLLFLAMRIKFTLYSEMFATLSSSQFEFGGMKFEAENIELKLFRSPPLRRTRSRIVKSNEFGRFRS